MQSKQMIDGHNMDITSIRQEQTPMLTRITGIGSPRPIGQRSLFPGLYFLMPADCGDNLDKSWRNA